MSIYQSATKSTSLPVIAGVEITTDSEGRFNLNALHKASGLGKAKQPANWLRLDSTKELINELDQSSDLRTASVDTVVGSANPGTYAHELLAIAYASWISPSFHLQVNQVFLDYRTGKLSQSVAALPQTYIEALECLIIAEKEKVAITLERDHAITTKAEIGSRREATAMAKASVETKRANKLADQLGEGRKFATVKAVERVTKKEYPYAPLRKFCKVNGLTPNDVPDKTYGTVKAWPAEAWLSVHGVDIKKLFTLKAVEECAA